MSSGQRIVDVFVKSAKRRRNDTAKLAAGDARNLFVDGHDRPMSSELDAVAFIEKFELGIEEDEFRFVAIEIHAAEEHHLAAGVEIARLKISAVKPFGVNEAAAIRENDVENLAAGSRLDHPAAIHTRMNCRILPDVQR